MSKKITPQKRKSLDWEGTKNLYIEGDSLDALEYLKKSMSGAVKLIYIDPPYNTGKAQAYGDSFGPGWSEFMRPRLELSRELLRDDGVFIASIDDNELCNLMLLCDEIFGRECRLGSFVVVSTPNARDYGHIGKMHEYALAYSKNINLAKTYPVRSPEKKFKYSDDQGGYNIHPLYNSNEAFHRDNRPNLFYPFYLNPKKVTEEGFFHISLKKDDGALEIFPPKSQRNGVQFVWRWGKEKAQPSLNKELVGYRTVSGDFRIVQKMRGDKRIIRSIINGREYTTRRGTRELEELFGEKVFSFPKPLKLIEDFIRFGAGEDSIILDFFGGSGTTAHGVLSLNAQDGGHRRFVLVQTPERLQEGAGGGFETASDLGRERIRRAGELLKKEHPDLDAGFRCYRI